MRSCSVRADNRRWGALRTSAQLALNQITKRYGTRVVLDRVSLTVKPGERLGVIGDNGSGKSTLLKLMADVERPDNGELVVVAPSGVGYLPQSLALPSHATVADAVDQALADLRELEARMRAAERSLGAAGAQERAGLDAYAELVAEFEARGGYEADVRVEVALHGLGLPGLDRSRPLGTLSGGERSRLALAATLASAPELLLLDEPTNDLDDQATAWLEQRLRAHRGTVVVITHDRMFLERVTTAILEVADGQVRRYGDGYAGYLAAKAAERAAQARAHEEWKTELDRHATLVAANAGRLAVIPRKTAKAGMGTGAWRARSRTHGAAGRIRQSQQRLQWLTDHPVAPPPEPLRFTAVPATAGAAAGDEVAALDGVVVAGRLRMESLTIRAGERLLVTGPNGAGKTTLMRVLAGELRPDAGEVRRAGRVGFFRQDEPDTDDRRWAVRAGTLRQDGPTDAARRTVLQAYAHGRPGSLDEHADALLALGLFRPSDLGLRLGELSYGQRRRIELARLVSEPVDLLLLDEPTNHLSPMLTEQLEEALASYQGALVVVTHDRRLRATFTGARVELADGLGSGGPCRAPVVAVAVEDGHVIVGAGVPAAEQAS
ncbi:macrolide transport system ATP-binding/permease protein [Thermomonospora echinospora]|uniref:Macrolide transport system ATP-binding/permease protein n=1 Tax=Thermomonospora echinospora TaxID=1992 RepID=A0A1H6DYY6_9ACTN|nr:ABC-F family ATP-binding cassette domain-containing protein [Thermomonospora echinospora]SEG90562.1 macrolide transport system ATP-binding/permease protein [Thermomonospora echinospora]